MPSKAYDKFADMAYPYTTQNPGSFAALTRDISTLPFRTVAGAGSALGQYASNPSTLQGVGDAFEAGITNPEGEVANSSGISKFMASMATDPLSLPLTMFGLPEAKAVSRLPALARVLVNAGQLGSINALDDATKQMSVKSDIRDFDVSQSTKAGLMGAGLGLGLGSLGVAIPALVNRLTTVSGKVGAFPVVQDKIQDLVAGHPSYGGPISQGTRDLIPYTTEAAATHTPTPGSITDFLIKEAPVAPSTITHLADDSRFIPKEAQEELLAQLGTRVKGKHAEPQGSPFLDPNSHAVHISQVTPTQAVPIASTSPFMSDETGVIAKGLMNLIREEAMKSKLAEQGVKSSVFLRKPVVDNYPSSVYNPLEQYFIK